MKSSISKAIFLSMFVAGVLPGCRAYRVKKAEFMRDDARGISSPSDRARALVDADCYVEHDRLPPSDPLMIACRKEKAPARLEEVMRSAKTEERPMLKAWAACIESYDGTGDAWSECRDEAQSAVPPMPKPSGEPAGPVHTSTTGSSTTS